MKSLIPFTLLFLITSVFGQQQEKDQTFLVKKAEEFILYNQIDSANTTLIKVKETPYVNCLKKIANGDEISYSDYNKFLNKVSNRFSISYKDISDFIQKNVKTPNSNRRINSDFVDLKWTQVSKLRDEVSLEAATTIQEELEAYINQYDDAKPEVLRLKTKITTHPIVMLNIKKDMKGKELCLQGLEIARKLKDVQLEIIFLYHLTDYLILERKLQEYIDTCEQALSIEISNNIESSYHFAIVSNLLDAYMYKGGAENRVEELLFSLYNDEDSKLYSFEFYMRFLNTVHQDTSMVKSVFKKFEVNSVVELAEKFKEEAKNLNALDYEKLLGASASTLARFGFFNEAISYKNTQIEMVKNTYSKDLSETLAKYETDLAIKEKEVEVKKQKEINRIYLWISIFTGIFFIISLFVIRKIRIQSKELDVKNKIISQNLKEKELLIKEVHHRVKNNFQIVSSLIELQTKGIEDEKALALAKEGKNRIRSMALIHQKLYQNDDGLVDFDDYLRLLVGEIHEIYASETEIKTTIVSKASSFSIDTAIPLGLIINEIITNSYKYAFQQNQENTLDINLQKDSEEFYRLSIKDNGPGFPDDLDVKKSKTLGLRLVNRLVKQLHGTLEVQNINGAHFTILFKDEHGRKSMS